MRRASLIAVAFVGAACSTFSEGDTPATTNDGGTPADADVDAGDGSACANATCAEIIASGQVNANEVLVDEQRVYWTIDDDTGTIMAREHAAGSVPYSVLKDKLRPRSLFRFSEFLHFAVSGDARHIERFQKDGGSSLGATALSNPITSVARVGGNLFATSGPRVEWCALVGNACEQQKFTVNMDVGSGARALAVDPSGTEIWLTTDTSLWKSDVAAVGWEEWWSIKNVRAFAIDETAVYIARDGEKGIGKMKRTDGRLAPLTDVLAPEASVPWALAIDGADVFYTAIDDGKVIKVSKDGAKVTILATNVERPKGIAVRLDKVYVALGDGRIVALPRN